MNKIDLIIGRMAFFCLLASVIAIVFNLLLGMTPLGMIEAIWRPSWVLMVFSVGVLLVLFVTFEEKSADTPEEKKETKTVSR